MSFYGKQIMEEFMRRHFLLFVWVTAFLHSTEEDHFVKGVSPLWRMNISGLPNMHDLKMDHG